MGQGVKQQSDSEAKKKQDLFKNSKRMQLDEAYKILDVDAKTMNKTYEEAEEVREPTSSMDR